MRINNSRGVSVLLVIIGLGLLAMIVQSNLVSEFLNLQKDWKNSTTFANKYHLLHSLSEDLAHGTPLQFSRYDINNSLRQCLTAQASCDETQFYEMALFAPILQQSFQGGLWPPAPFGAPLIAGGKNNYVTLYRSSGDRCPLQKTAADSFCPLQAIVEFRPLCGGSIDFPAFNTPPGPCTQPATGVEITIGVARLMNGRLVYRRNVDSGGDAKVYRFPASLLRN